MKRAIRIALAFVACPLLAGVGHVGWANTIYTYTGNTYTDVLNNTNPPGTYDTTMRITGSFVVSDQLGANLSSTQVTPISFSFFDGRSEITNLSVPLRSDTHITVSTDSLGNITFWDVYLVVAAFHTPYYDIHSEKSSGSAQDFAEINTEWWSGSNLDWAKNTNSAGSWSTNAIPEPASLALLGLGLACLGFRRRSPVKG